MSAEFLKIEGVTKKFGDFAALSDIDLSIAEGEFVCLLGPSGCGKTTLLRIIAGLEKQTAGKIYMQGDDITSLHPSKRNFGIVFQSYALFPNMTVKQNISFGLKGKKLKKAEIDEKVAAVLKQVNLEDQIKKYPSQLSGGQQQRIALARALVLSPKFLLLDEPLSALDAKVRQKVRKEIKALQSELGITTIMVTHDQEEALTMADKIVVMNNACIRQIGTPQEIYDNPVSPFVADFVGSINFFTTPIDEQSDEAKSKMNTNHYKLKAIRPENINIVGQDIDGGIKVKVKDIEFHGPAYRLTLSMKDDGEYVVADDYVTIDVPSAEFMELGIKKKDKIKVFFKEDKLLFYKTDMEGSNFKSQ